MLQTEEQPLLMSGDLVRATLARLKTETRRPIKQANGGGDGVPAAAVGATGPGRWVAWWGGGAMTNYVAMTKRHYRPDQGWCCPFGGAGDRLWVRETIQPMERMSDGVDGVRYVADEAFVPIANTREASDGWLVAYHYRGKRGAVIPSIHMPRWACRLVLPLAEVRVERLQDITEEGAMAEGFENRTRFFAAWDGIYGKQPGLSWDHSPWVWVLRWNAAEILTGEAAAPGRAA